MTKLQERQDPDPAKRPLLQTGQPALDALLGPAALATAQAEVFTPAFVAPPAVCDAAGHTFVYAVIPTASSDVTTNAAGSSAIRSERTSRAVCPLCSRPDRIPHHMRTSLLTNRYMSDEFANNNGASYFPDVFHELCG